MAQFILESGWSKSELETATNNVFGMKTTLSGNTWPGTTWKSSNVYKKTTWEQKKTVEMYQVVADFRKYNSVEESIRDHSAYLLGARDEKGNLRYQGIGTEKDYKKAAKIIHNGDYATSLTYSQRLIDIIETYNLTLFDL